MSALVWPALVWPVFVGMTLGLGLVALVLVAHDRRPSLVRRVRAGLPARAPGGPGAGAPPWAWAVRTVEAIGSTTSSVERRLQLLGRANGLGLFRLQQLLAALAGAVVGGGAAAAVVVSRGASGVVLTVPLLVLGALLGAALWDQALSLRARARQRAIDSQVPDASEILALAVGAGESVPGALERVARLSSSDLAGELMVACREIRLGTPTTRALDALAARNDSPSLDRLCQTLTTAIDRGSPLAGVLHDQARDLRESTRQALMELGGRREIAMLVPVVFLILPVTVLFALYPGLIALEIGP